MTFAEYMYIDKTRVDSYFEQISSPVTFDKKRTWNVGLSLTGPVAGGSQSSHPRPQTRHEKMCAILDHLQRNSRLAPPEQSPCASFVFESLDATPVHVPVPKKSELKRDSMILWVGASRSFQSGFRFLLEDYSGTDNEEPVLSGFSCLRLMLDEFGKTMREFFTSNIKRVEEQTNEDVLQALSWDVFPGLPYSAETREVINLGMKRAGIPHVDELAVLNWRQGPDIKWLHVAIRDRRYSLTMSSSQLRIERDGFAEVRALITSEPLDLFARWGAKIGAQRAIDVLYRVREAGKEFEVLPELRTVTVVGYPICLMSHPSPFTEKYITGL